jgi:hypothetical protein
MKGVIHARPRRAPASARKDFSGFFQNLLDNGGKPEQTDNRNIPRPYYEGIFLFIL